MGSWTGPIQLLSWLCQAPAPICFIPTVLFNLHLKQIPNPYLLGARRSGWVSTALREKEFDHCWEYTPSSSILVVHPVSTKVNGYIPNTNWTLWWVVEHKATYGIFNKKKTKWNLSESNSERQQTSSDLLSLNH